MEEFSNILQRQANNPGAAAATGSYVALNAG
jgi:hypothetical protein